MTTFKLNIEIDTSNAAFHDYGPGALHMEVDRICRGALTRLEYHDTQEYTLHDHNGNKTGTMVIEWPETATQSNNE